MKYCPNCKRDAGDDMVFCMECGTKLQDKPENTEKEARSKQPKEETDKKKNSRWVWILLAIVFCVWAIVMTVLYTEEKDTNERQHDRLVEWRDKANELQEQVDFMDKFLVIVLDDGSDYYHTYDCYEKYGGSFWAYNINAAESKGYTPCPDCY